MFGFNFQNEKNKTKIINFNQLSFFKPKSLSTPKHLQLLQS